MNKIPTIFVRDKNDMGRVTDECNGECLWVFKGEGIPTRKLDGTCCMVRGGVLYKRYTLRRGRVAPRDFEPATEIDPNTGKQEGWLPVSATAPDDKYHREAFEWEPDLPNGTYELVGPKVQGGAEDIRGGVHVLEPHGRLVLAEFDETVRRTFVDIREWLGGQDIEGIVWHHPDGRMAKIKKRDFGLPRKPTS